MKKYLLAGLGAALAISLLCAFEGVYQTAGGTVINTAATDKLGFYGATPVTQPTSSSQAAITDSTTGTAGTALAAGAGVQTIAIPVNLASVADGDVLTNYTPGYKFKLLSVSFAVSVPASTADKLTTLNLEIGTTNVTGGEIALTTANCTPIGAVVAGAAITAANTGSASATISIEAASTTAFVEGAGYVLLKIQNMDTADAIASLARLQDQIRSTAVNVGLMKGS